MDLIQNKTIEEMAKKGYSPVLGAGIVFSEIELGVNAVRDSEYLANAAKQALQMYKSAYPSSNLVALIETFVIKTKMIHADGEKQALSGQCNAGTHKVIMDGQTRYAYPVQAYARTNRL